MIQKKDKKLKKFLDDAFRKARKEGRYPKYYKISSKMSKAWVEHYLKIKTNA